MMLEAKRFILLATLVLSLLLAVGCDPTATPSPDSGITPEPTTDGGGNGTPAPATPDASPEPTPTPAGIEIRLPDDVTVEATSASGTPFAFATPLATGGTGTVTVTCDPAPGTAFPIGENVVTCTATDGVNTEVAEFKVTVQDTTPPVLTTPTNVETTAVFGETSATVTFAVPSGVDLVDGPVTASCEPAAGTAFAVGTTTVTCSASDNAGNAGSVVFQILVNEGEVPRVLASGCPAAGQGQNLPPLPMFVKGEALLDNAPAPDGVLVFVRLTNQAETPDLQICDSDAVNMADGEYSLVMAPPEITAAWFSNVEFYVDGRLATPTHSITANNYRGGTSVTANLLATSP